MLEIMEIGEFIYEVVVEPHYKKSTRAYDNRVGHSKKIIVESALSKTYSEMSKISVKRNQRYVYHMRDLSKLTCLIRVPGNSSDKFKVLKLFRSKYTKGIPTK